MSIASTATCRPSSHSPFVQGRYSSPISVKVLQDQETNAFFIQVIGKRITLENLQGSHYELLKERFQDHVIKHKREFEDLKEIFGDAETRKWYADGLAQSDEKVVNRIEFNSKRAIDGNPFTGFAVLDNRDRKIIGFVTLGRGPNNGESQSALILNRDFHSQNYGLETALLMGALAHRYYLEQFKVGSSKAKEPVKIFSAVCKDNDEKMIRFITDLGLRYLRPVEQKAWYTDQSESLYSIEAEKVSSLLEQYIDLKQLHNN